MSSRSSSSSVALKAHRPTGSMAHEEPSGLRGGKVASITSIPDVSLILNETVSLVASMRKQARWSTSSVAAILGGAAEANFNEDKDLATRWGLRGSRATVSENPLLAGFSKLRQDLLNVQGMRCRRSRGRLLMRF